MSIFGDDDGPFFKHFFDAGDSGDVVAARTFAETLLAHSKVEPAMLRQARPLLTMAAMHLHAHIGWPATPPDMIALLAGLVDEGALGELTKSSMDLVKYLALEIVDWGRDERIQVVGVCLEAIERLATRTG